jgi:hypothetical protein
MAIYGTPDKTPNQTAFKAGDVIQNKNTRRNKVTVVAIHGFKIYAKDDLNKMGMYFMAHNVELYSPAIDQQETVSWWAS